ncbi:MAG: hypothetical protein MPJ50_15005, partial [Pirellulales bacterium]|nr:hypothetical protein [Pirellulales bacterium]
MFRSPRPFVLCAALLSGVLASPTTSDACWFHGTFAPRTTYRPLFPRTTYYAPTTAYYPSTACCTTANYTTA